MTAKKKADGKGKPKEELKLDLLPGLIGYQLRLAQLSVFGDFAAELKDFDISPGRFGVLVLISANPGMTQSQLASAASMKVQTLQRYEIGALDLSHASVATVMSLAKVLGVTCEQLIGEEH